MDEKIKKIEENIENSYRARKGSSDSHYDSWWIQNFTVSQNQQFVAFVVRRTYENYVLDYDDDYNKVVVKNTETRQEVSTAMVKFLKGKEENQICSIIDITDDGKATYMTGDKVEHTLSFSASSN